jgi:hypothetical protein
MNVTRFSIVILLICALGLSASAQDAKPAPADKTANHKLVKGRKIYVKGTKASKKDVATEKKAVSTKKATDAKKKATTQKKTVKSNKTGH